MGKCHCLYCGVKLPDDGPSVRIAKGKLICMKCYDEHHRCIGPEFTDEVTIPKPTYDYCVKFAMINNHSYETVIANQTEEIQEFIAKMVSKPYASILAHDKSLMCINLQHVTQIYVALKEKEE